MVKQIFMKEIHGLYLRLGLTLFHSLMILMQHQMIVVCLLVELFSSIRHCEETKYVLDYSMKTKYTLQFTGVDPGNI